MKITISILLLLCFTAFAQEIIDISVKGISDIEQEGARKTVKKPSWTPKGKPVKKPVYR